MKTENRVVMLLLAGLLLATAADAQSLNTNLRAYWSFEVTDRTGGGSDFYQVAPGKIGKSLTVSGGQHIMIPNNANLVTGLGLTVAVRKGAILAPTWSLAPWAFE